MPRRTIINFIVGFLICLSGFFILISQLRLEKDRVRTITKCAVSTELKSSIDIVCNSCDSPEKIIKECSRLVCKQLSFTAKNNIPNGRANCVGYAQLTTAVINHAFQLKSLPYTAKPVVGKVYLFGIDLNNIAQKILPEKHRPFFKDHDFVEIDLGHKTAYVDSSLQDLTGLTFMQIHNK